MKYKQYILVTFLFLLLLNFYLLYSQMKLRKSYSDVSGQKTSFTTSSTKLEKEIDNLKKKDQNLELQLDILKENQGETLFFINNKRRYEYFGGQFILSHCCTGPIDNSIFLGYDLLVENPKGSGHYDDFGTTSYISFDQGDKIKSFNATQIGAGIYKITIDSDYKHTEGVIYPASESGLYYRLYNLTENPYANYYVTISPDVNGYKFIVNKGSSKTENPDGEYLLKRNDGGYDLEVIKQITHPKN